MVHLNGDLAWRLALRREPALATPARAQVAVGLADDDPPF
jgi:hypothetical protein